MKFGNKFDDLFKNNISNNKINFENFKFFKGITLNQGI